MKASVLLTIHLVLGVCSSVKWAHCFSQSGSAASSFKKNEEGKKDRKEVPENQAVMFTDFTNCDSVLQQELC